MKVIQVDAFASRPFEGNPAAVCLLDQFPEDELMLSIAGEMNLSETAFLVPDQPGSYAIRWFTPKIEVELCGHATLASAHVLWSEQLWQGDLVFRSRGGDLKATRDSSGWIRLDFPQKPAAPAEVPAGICEALGLHEPTFVGRSAYDYLVVVESEQQVRGLEPQLESLGKIEARGVIVTAPGDRDFDFVSRFFAPAVGVNEDPVTGSAHCVLAPYWTGRLKKTRMLAFQASRRGGTVRVELQGDRVWLGGQAVTTLRGELVNCPLPAGSPEVTAKPAR